MARQRTPLRREYVRRLAEAMAVLRLGQEMVGSLLGMPREGFAKLWSHRDGGDIEQYRRWLLADLEALGYNMAVSLDSIEGEMTCNFRDLADRITVTLDVAGEGDAGGANPNESALAAG